MSSVSRNQSAGIGALLLIALLTIISPCCTATEFETFDEEPLQTPTWLSFESDGFHVEERLSEELFRDDLVNQPTQPTLHHDLVNEITFNSSQEPLMIYSTGLSIRGYWMRSGIHFDIAGPSSAPPKTQPPSISQALSVFFDVISFEQTPVPKTEQLTTKSRSTIVGVDMDPHDKEVFWVELGKDAGVYSTLIDSEHFEARHRRKLWQPTQRALVDSGLLSPEDVSLDMVGENVYVTDAGLPAIVVCSIKHSHCKIIVKENIHKPRAIIVDPRTGWLFYSDWGDHPGIFLVSMDGQRRETLIDTDVTWPNGLAADFGANQLYWADAHLSKIERVDLSTRKRHDVIREAAANPFSLAVFENRIYWSDWSGSEIKTCDKITGNGTKSLMRTENIYGIHIYHPNLGSKPEDPCWSKRCSHLCLLGPSSAAFADRRVGSVTAGCACPESMVLNAGDKSSCHEVSLSFLLINVNNYIAQLFPERVGLQTIEKIIYSKEHTIHDVASDWFNSRLFFYDALKQFIYMVDMEAKGTKLSRFLPTSSSVRGLLYDDWSDNLYWLDSENGTMSMCSVAEKFEVLLRKDLDQPVSMALDSKNRLFYIAMLGSHPRIIRTDIFGHKSSDLVIIGAANIGLPVALHLDEQQQRLYWADARRETIESLDLDIANESTGLKAVARKLHRHKLGTILALAIHDQDFLWTVKNGEYLYKAKITGSLEENKPVSLRLPPNLSTKDPSSNNRRIILIDPLRSVSTSPCLKSGCSHGCVLDSNKKPVCVSAEPLVDNKTITCLDGSESCPADEGNRMIWLIVLLILLSVTGLITIVSLLILYKQGRLPRQVSQLSVSFISQSHDKDGAMLLLDSDA